jgi:hypothetical protein
MLSKYKVYQKEFYNSIPNVTLWRVLRKRLHWKGYKLSIVQHTQGHGGSARRKASTCTEDDTNTE